MLNRTKYFLVVINLALIAVILGIYFKISDKGYKNQFYFYPKLNNNVTVSKEKIDDINENKFLITYEISESKIASTTYSKKQVLLKKTNYTYKLILDYNLLAGSFFTKEMQTANSSSVVLNEFAAFKLFGGIDCINNELDIDGKTYSVVGIIDDYDSKNLNVFTITSEVEDTAFSCIAYIDQKNGVKEQLVKNQLKEIGITFENYTFVNLQILYNNIVSKCIVSIVIVLIFLLLLILKSLIIILLSNIYKLKKLLKTIYLKNIFKENGFFALRFIINTLAVIATVGFILILCIYTLTTLLESNFFIFNINNTNITSFVDYISIIKSMNDVSNICLVFILILNSAFYIKALSNKSTN